MSAVVLITGSSTGFGRDASERLARRGHHVFATMRNTRGRNAEHRVALEDLAARENLRLQVLDLDVTDEVSVQSAVSNALAAAGRLDVVINNAGFAGIGVTEAYTPEQYQQLFDVNVYGVVRVNRAVLPSMRERGSGLLVHVSSGAGRVTVPGLAVYCASKHAMEGFTKAMAIELAPHKIRVNTIAPTFIETPMTRPFFENEAFRKDTLSRIKLGRLGQLEELAGAIVYLASDASSLMTGSSMVIDGGWTAE
jgi:NAD(P)-dependent dehydrogenase (short-subunit alcohol dehydrogenase family)